MLAPLALTASLSLAAAHSPAKKPPETTVVVFVIQNEAGQTHVRSSTIQLNKRATRRLLKIIDRGKPVAAPAVTEVPARTPQPLPGTSPRAMFAIVDDEPATSAPPAAADSPNIFAAIDDEAPLPTSPAAPSGVGPFFEVIDD